MRRRVAATVVICWAAAVSAQVPQLISYQGRLLDGTNLVNGSVGLSLRLYNASGLGTLLYEDSNTVTVADGLYSTFIGDQTNAGNFVQSLTNAQVWVEVAVNGLGLAPRERLASVGYALVANGVTTGAITGAMLADSSITSLKIADGAIANSDINVAANIAGSKIAAGSISNTQVNAASFSNTFWKVDGNAGTVAGSHFLGTTDNRPVEVRANNLRALLVQPFNGAPNVVLGSDDNVVSNNTRGASILGGSNNVIATGAAYSLLGGGTANRIGEGSIGSVLGGGALNEITNVWLSVLAGGSSNTIAAYSDNSVLAGGTDNHIGANSIGAALLGGEDNTMGVNADYSVIAGGRSNSVADNAKYAFAAGRNAKANHAGTFVWADQQDREFVTTASNQFLIRASRGVAINTTNPVVDFRVYGQSILGSNIQATILTSTNIVNLMVGQTTNSQINGLTFWEQGSFGMSLGYDGTGLGSFNKLVVYDDVGNDLFIFQNSGRLGIGVSNPTNLIHVAGGAQCNGSTWLNSSDRNLKENFQPVDPARVLEKVEALPISEWSYKRDGGAIRHVGPTAQDFYATFGLGDNDTTISTIDPSGVALAAIQELARQNADLKAQVEALKARLEALENR